MLMILHRFSSPEWWEHVKRHVCAEISADDVFNKIVGLKVRNNLVREKILLTIFKTGQAMVLSPSGLITAGETGGVRSLGRRYILMKSRRRVTRDGGTSVLVVGSTDVAS